MIVAVLLPLTLIQQYHTLIGIVQRNPGRRGIVVIASSRLDLLLPAELRNVMASPDPDGDAIEEVPRLLHIANVVARISFDFHAATVTPTD